MPGGIELGINGENKIEKLSVIDIPIQPLVELGPIVQINGAVKE